ncbi:transcription initiation factor TFIIE subunit alpha [Nematocida sp. AWRm80]|nr:transcription initiation factor TFIIE subunit alpha [Nematocida sp. AWRm80]
MDSLHSHVKDLVQRVTRMFYEPCHIVIMDIMLEYLVLAEEDLADKMKLLPREFNKMVVRLREDKLLSAETISDMQPDGRQTTHTLYFLDFRTIRDVIKYKIYTMTQQLEKRMRECDGALVFGCPECKTVYSLLDAQSFLSVDDYTFKCPECKEELKEKKEVQEDKKENASHLFSLMMEIISELISQLKLLDTIGIPEMSRGQIIQATPSSGQKQLHAPEIPQALSSEPVQQLEIYSDEPDLPEEDSINDSADIIIGLDDIEDKDTSPILDNRIEDTLTVNGVQKRFIDITEEDKDQMNEEEYEKYFDLYEKYHK